MSTCTSSYIPAYADLAKAAKDLFTKGYNYGSYKLDLKTKLDCGLEIHTALANHHDNGTVSGNLEMKNKVSKDYGLSWSSKWSLENTVSAEVAIEDQLIQGLKLAVDGNFVPLSGKKNAVVRAIYKSSKVHGNIDADVTGPNLSGAVVFGYKGWMGGCHLSYDTCRSVITNFSIAGARSSPDCTIYWSFNNSGLVQSSIYHKVNDNLEIAIKKGWSMEKSETKFSMAAKYSWDKNMAIRAKLNNRCLIGLSYQQRLHDAVMITLSTLIEGKRLSEPCHKFGLGLEFEF